MPSRVLLLRWRAALAIGAAGHVGARALRLPAGQILGPVALSLAASPIFVTAHHLVRVAATVAVALRAWSRFGCEQLPRAEQVFRTAPMTRHCASDLKECCAFAAFAVSVGREPRDRRRNDDMRAPSPRRAARRRLGKEKRMDDKSDALGYWRANMGLVKVILVIWAVVSFGLGIVFRPMLQGITIGGADLGFWFAQQGSIFVYLILIFAYAALMNGIDQKYDVHE